MIKSFYTDELKKKALEKYIAYWRIVDEYDASCGRELLEYINPELAAHKKVFNEIMDLFAKNDPDCPKYRL